MHTLYESTCIIGYCICWIVGEWFICVGVLQVCVNFDEVVFCVHYENSSTLSHSLMARSILSFPLILDYCKVSNMEY